MKNLTAEWVRKAEEDYDGARRLTATKPPLHDLVCFHCQQAAEKYLKALLQELGLAIPRIHELDVLLDLLLPHDVSLRSLRRAVNILTQYAVDYRYPGMNATARQSRSALRWAEQTRDAVRARLGLPVRRTRRRKP